jgi:hypothetical protein
MSEPGAAEHGKAAMPPPRPRAEDSEREPDLPVPTGALTATNVVIDYFPANDQRVAIELGLTPRPPSYYLSAFDAQNTHGYWFGPLLIGPEVAQFALVADRVDVWYYYEDNSIQKLTCWKHNDPHFNAFGIWQ